MVSKKQVRNCCYGCGYWAWGNFVPMGIMDANDGTPTLPCPTCGSNPNPIKKKGKIIKTREELEKFYEKKS